MKITDVKVFPVDEDKLKAYATITFDNCFIVRDLKVISGNKGYFIAMPSKKRKDGTFRDVAHPLNSETRKMIEDAVLEVYKQESASGASTVPYPESEAEEATFVEEPATGEEPSEEPEKGAEENPTIEPSDDPEKAFGYEE
ncbi:MAG: septation regulator SpoVG [bacterium]|nr:MAG: septation regulator SpoVG [bacterium]